MTTLIRIKNNENIDLAVQTIAAGGLVVFPTETVYGIGANALNELAVDKVFHVKGRPNDNPLIVHVAKREMVDAIAEEITDVENMLMDHFWPGPLTIVFKKKDIIPHIVSGNLDTVGVRMPDNNATLELIAKAKVPIVGPSANISGKPSGTMIEDIYEELNNKVDVIMDDGNTQFGIESTVVKVEGNKIIILRPGIITPEDIKQLGLEVELAPHLFNMPDITQKVVSPGVKYRHYAPNANAILLYSKNANKLIDAINELAIDNKVVLLLTEKNISSFPNLPILNLGKNYYEISRNIFTLLRQADKLNPDLIIIEGVEMEGIGIAIMNRLIRACSYNYTELD